MGKRMNATQKIIAAMMKENTGVHLLDSGGAYGRNWQRNQALDFMSEPSATLEIKKYGERTEISVSINLFYFLSRALEYDAETQNKLDRYSDENPELYGTELIKDFVKSAGGIQTGSDNSYNSENMLSQDFQYFLWDSSKDRYIRVFIQVHGGCDIRGGYSNPKCFFVKDESIFYSMDRAIILCDCQHYWDYESYGKWHNSHLPNLETFPIVKSDENDEIDLISVVQRTREYNALNDTRNKNKLFTHIFGNQPSEIPLSEHSAIIIDSAGMPRCPVCGTRLRATI